MSALLRLSVVFCLFVVAYSQVVHYPGGVVEVTEVSYVDEAVPVQPNVVLVGGAQRPSVKTNMFGLPSVGGGLADIGRTLAHWGGGVLRAAGKMSTMLRLSVIFAVFVAVHCQIFPGAGVVPGGVVEVTEVSYVDEAVPVQPNVVVVGAQRPSVKTNMFGLPSVGGGLADIGRTLAHWGGGVLRAAGTIV
ncbi:hypothetical protein C0J52_04327 [Blattella germanica]|nr:hypothetical protein C0J52_04327 [Blattella germanica]